MHSTLGTYMAGQRRLRALRQRDIAAALGVAPNTLRAWENDVSHPTTPQLAAWAAALDLGEHERSDVAALVLPVFDIGGGDS